MAESTPDEHREIITRIVGLYNVLYEDGLTRTEIEFYEIEDDRFEGEIYLPEIGLNVDLWSGWSTEKRVEVLLHEFAHAENYDDDHHPDFWDRVVSLTERTLARRSAVGDVFDASIDPTSLKRAVVDSIHESDIEAEIDSVARRRREVGASLGLPPDHASST